MILVDTSIWIELLAGRLRIEEQELPRFAVCGPIVQEVFLGLKPGRPSEIFREVFGALPVLSDPIGLDLFVAAADIYRQGRRRGLTIRSSVDCLIAAIAIRNAAPIWHRDRDFTVISAYTALEISKPPVVRK